MKYLLKLFSILIVFTVILAELQLAQASPSKIGQSMNFEQAQSPWHIKKYAHDTRISVATGFDSNTLLVVTKAGNVYLTTDGGISWKLRSNGNGFGSKSNIEFSVVNENVLYATTGGAIYRTINGGKQWLKMTHNEQTRLSEYQYSDIYAASQNIVYASIYCKSGVTPSCAGPGLYKSMDGGEHWKRIQKWGTYGVKVVNGVLFAQQDYKILKSVDGGDSWVEIYDGRAVPQYDTVSISEITALNKNIIFASGRTLLHQGEDSLEQIIMLKSLDGGKSWKDITPIEDAKRTITAIKPFAIEQIIPRSDNEISIIVGCEGGRDDVYYIRYTTTDGGKTWSKQNQYSMPPGDFLGWLWDYTIFFYSSNEDPQTIYIGSPDSMYKSIDGGISWDLIFDRQKNYN